MYHAWKCLFLVVVDTTSSIAWTTLSTNPPIHSAKEQTCGGWLHGHGAESMARSSSTQCLLELYYTKKEGYRFEVVMGAKDKDAL